MKIIKPGNCEEKKQFVYRTTCPICRCTFEFEPNEVIISEKRLNGNKVIDCPYCKTRLNLTYKDYILIQK